LESLEADLQELVDGLSLEDKVALLTGQDSWSMRALPAIGLRSIVMSDGPAGVRGTRWDERDPSCNFPSPISVAASWDRSLVRAVGHGLGSEARRKGVHVVLAPTVNLHRTPYGGRHFEAFSEDPLLTAVLASQYVAGIQAHGVAATVKHYVANDSETDRYTVDVRVRDRPLRELYLSAFEGPVVDGRSWVVMSAYNSVNGATASESPLLTTPLQDAWRFTGVVVSDWTAVRSLEAARHPQDVVMPGPDGPWGHQLVDAVRAGEVEEKLVDRKVLRILRLAARVGALDGFPAERRTDDVLSATQLRELARSAARDGMVLLVNDRTLPLGAPQRIAVIGEAARIARTQGGGSATVVPAAVTSPLEGIRQRWPDATVTWSRGASLEHDLTPLESGTFHTADGEPGLLVRYLDPAGNERAREVRQSSWLVWFNGVSPATTSAAIEVAFRYSPTVTSPSVHLGIAGLADVEVHADGRLLAEEKIRTSPGDDPSTVVLNPPMISVEAPVIGESVDIVVRFRRVPGAMPDAVALRVGTLPDEKDPASLAEEAAGAAADADVAVVVVGTSGHVESEGFDRTTLRLPGEQDALVQAVAAVNPRTVVVVNAGAPLILPWRHDVAAIIAAWFPGQEFGHALADVLSGDVDPGGRLPVSWPDLETDVPVSDVTPVDGRLTYREGIHVGYKAWMRNKVPPAFPFGHGLSYTRWKLSALEASAPVGGDDGRVSLQVTNVGQRSGKAVVQVYLERVSASKVDRPVRWLAGFDVVRLGAAEAAPLEIPLPWRRFAHWENEAWQVEPGTYRVLVGLSCTDDHLSADLELDSVTPRRRAQVCDDDLFP
jgi:beta-glucosidase